MSDSFGIYVHWPFCAQKCPYCDFNSHVRESHDDAEWAAAIGKDEPPRKIQLKVYGSSGWDRDAFLLPGVNLEFSDIRYTNFPVVVLNLETPSALLGFQVGGIVGHKFLSKYRVGIDLEHSVLRLKAI